MRKVIPKRIDLPFGFRVAVQRVSPKELADRLDEDLGDEGLSGAGFWDHDEMTIYIDKNMPRAQQRYILAHELQHAVADLLHMLLIEGVAKTP